MALEFILEQFPLERKLRDGTSVVLRPLARSDAAKLHKFFTLVPELERLAIAERITDRAVVDRWCRNLDPEKQFTLLLLTGSKVIGEATLRQNPGGWKRHIGSLTLLTHPEYRGRDVSKLIAEEIIEVARHLGMSRLECELNGERTTALKSLEGLGFKQLLHLQDYVMDMQTITHDYHLMGMELLTDEEFTAAG